MKRDTDYIRQLLFEVEDDPSPVFLVTKTIDSSAENLMKEHHVDLLCDAGFLVQITDYGYRMTNEGHDYLDAIRNETVWRKTREAAASVAGVPLGILKEIAVDYAKSELKTKLGVEI